MNYVTHLKFLLELMEKNNGNITQSAKDFCQRMNIPYTDNVRRSISKTLRKNMPSKDMTDEVLEQINKFEENTEKGTAYLEAICSHQPKTLEDAIQISQVDLDVWEIEKWLWNSWGVTSWKSGHAEERTNYQVKMWLKRRVRTFEDVLEDILPKLEHPMPLSHVNVLPSQKTGVLTIADLHTGAKVKDLLRTEDYDVNILRHKLTEIAQTINQMNFKEVHLNMLGDFFESLSGLSHLNTFKSLEEDMWGANPIIFTHKILCEFLGRISNLASINMVAGNHDRMTISREVDNTGEGAKLLYYMLQQSYPDLTIRFHTSVLSLEIDGINYLLTHGDKGYSKKSDFSKFILEYGLPNMFTLSLQGHWHSRTTKKVYHEVEALCRDEVDYRMMVCPSVFTGNWYSESQGFSSSSGFIVTFNNGKGKPNVMDFSL